MAAGKCAYKIETKFIHQCNSNRMSDTSAIVRFMQGTPPASSPPVTSPGAGGGVQVRTGDGQQLPVSGCPAVRRSFKFRLRPTRKQEAALTACLEDTRQLYNAALEERREAWRMGRHKVTFYSQDAQLKEIRANDPERYGRWSFTCERAAVRRLDRAFQLPASTSWASATSASTSTAPSVAGSRPSPPSGKAGSGVDRGIRTDRCQAQGTNVRRREPQTRKGPREQALGALSALRLT
jgi:hypothetical protein